MLRLLMVLSLVAAAGFIVHSGFRRRLVWALNVTFVVYAVFFAVRLVIWPFLDLDPEQYLVVAATGLASFVIWFVLRLVLEKRSR